MKAVVIIAPTYYAAEEIAKRRAFPDWYWVASTDLADIWADQCRAFGIDIDPTYVYSATPREEAA